MDLNLDKENVQRDEHKGGYAQPSLNGFLAPSSASSTEEPSTLRASIDSIRSLDVSNNIPRILSPMDAEDSPWGGMRLSHSYRFRIAF